MDELEELIIFWKDYRAEHGVGLREMWEKVNDTIIALEELQSLKKSGIDKFTKTEV